MVRTNRPVSGELVEGILTEMEAAFRELRCAATARLVKHGVSMTQVHILWLLAHHGEMPMNHLAELLGVGVSNATGLIDRMEERGLVERVRVVDDRRLVMVRPAAEGRSALDEIEGLRRDQLRRVLAHLDASEQDRVAEGFAAFRKAIDEEFGSRPEHHHFATAGSG